MTLLLLIAALIATLCVSYALTPYIKRRAFNFPFLAIAFDCALGLALFGTLHALSPQAFYQFYHLIYSGLPHQIVVKTLFDYEGMATFAALSTSGNLSQHLSGLVLLAIVPLTVFTHILPHEKQKKLVKNQKALLMIAPICLITVNFFRQI